MNRIGIAVAAAATLALAACGSSDKGGVELYGTTFGPTASLVQLDPNTGALVRTVGPVGYQVNGLEWDHTTGKLYATTSFNDANFPDGLLEINLSTGAGTPIGTGAGMQVLNPTVNSTGTMYGWTEQSDDPVTINKTTGVATVVGNSAVSSAVHGLAFDNQDVLYLVNFGGALYTINATTGAGTAAGSLGVTAHHGDFHPGTGMYWGLDTTGTGPRNIIVANIATATVTATMPTVDSLFTLTFKR